HERHGRLSVRRLGNVEGEPAADFALVRCVQDAPPRLVVAQGGGAQALDESVVVASRRLEEPATHRLERRGERTERLLDSGEAAAADRRWRRSRQKRAAWSDAWYTGPPRGQAAELGRTFASARISGERGSTKRRRAAIGWSGRYSRSARTRRDVSELGPSVRMANAM